MVFDCVYGRQLGGCDKYELSPPLGGDSTSLYHNFVHCSAFLYLGPRRARGLRQRGQLGDVEHASWTGQ
jgi:hypothetical protein